MWSNSHVPLGHSGVARTTSDSQPSRSVPSTGPWTTFQPDGAFSTQAELPSPSSPDESNLTTYASHLDMAVRANHQASPLPGSKSMCPMKSPAK
jgi:hypothetical protein